MTKAELLEYLEPFSDDIEIVVGVYYHDIRVAEYFAPIKTYPAVIVLHEDY